MNHCLLFFIPFVLSKGTLADELQSIRHETQLLEVHGSVVSASSIFVAVSSI